MIASLYWAKAVLIPLALAFMLTFLLQPIVATLRRRGLGHTPAVMLVVMLLALVLGAVGWTVIRQFSSLASELPGYKDNLKQKIDDMQSASKGGVFEKIQATIAELTREFEHNPSPTTAAQEPVAGTPQGSRWSRTCHHFSHFRRYRPGASVAHIHALVHERLT